MTLSPTDPDDGLVMAVPTVFAIRGQAVALDVVAARELGVTTKQANQAASRNPDKFTDAHRFQLGEAEWAGLRSHGVTANSGRGGRRTAPWVYTQKGFIRLATILNSREALDATDRMIDLFLDVYGQLLDGRGTIAVARPERLVQADGGRWALRFRRKLEAAMDQLLDARVDGRRETTLREELAKTGDGLLAAFHATLRAKGVANEKLEAETLLVLEKAREVRARLEADLAKSAEETESLRLANFDKKLDIVERLLRLDERVTPNAFATLVPAMIASADPRILAALPAPGETDNDEEPE